MGTLLLLSATRQLRIKKHTCFAIGPGCHGYIIWDVVIQATTGNTLLHQFATNTRTV